MGSSDEARMLRAVAADVDSCVRSLGDLRAIAQDHELGGRAERMDDLVWELVQLQEGLLDCLAERDDAAVALAAEQRLEQEPGRELELYHQAPELVHHLQVLKCR